MGTGGLPGGENHDDDDGGGTQTELPLPRLHRRRHQINEAAKRGGGPKPDNFALFTLSETPPAAAVEASEAAALALYWPLCQCLPCSAGLQLPPSSLYSCLAGCLRCSYRRCYQRVGCRYEGRRRQGVPWRR